MKRLSPEEIVWLGSALAVELSKGKSKEELRELRALLSQVISSLNTLTYF